MADIEYVQFIKDAVHGELGLTATEKRLISDSVVSRLSYTTQLGMTSFVYPGGRHTRFDHSIGVASIAGRMLETLLKNEKEDNILTWKRHLIVELYNLLTANNVLNKETTPPSCRNFVKKNQYLSYNDFKKIPLEITTRIEKSLVKLIRIAGLLHDLGHLPFSHVFENVITHVDIALSKLTEDNSTNRTSSIVKQIIFTFTNDTSNQQNPVLKQISFDIEKWQNFREQQIKKTDEKNENDFVLLLRPIKKDQSIETETKLDHELITQALIKHHLSHIINFPQDNKVNALLGDNAFIFGKLTADLLLIILSLPTKEELETIIQKAYSTIDDDLKKEQITNFLSVMYPLHQIISSSIDADRLDYVLRDLQMTNLKNGNFDLDRIITSISIGIAKNNPIRYFIVYKSRALSSIIAYYTTRVGGYKWIIFHPVVLVFDELLKLISEYTIISLAYERQETNSEEQNTSFSSYFCDTCDEKDLFIKYLVKFLKYKDLSEQILLVLFSGKTTFTSGNDENPNINEYCPNIQLNDVTWLRFIKKSAGILLKQRQNKNNYQKVFNKIDHVLFSKRPFVTVNSWELVADSLFFRENLPIPLWRNIIEYKETLFNEFIKKIKNELMGSNSVLKQVINKIINNPQTTSQISDKIVTLLNNLILYYHLLNINKYCTFPLNNLDTNNFYDAALKPVEINLIHYLIDTFMSYKRTTNNDPKNNIAEKMRQKINNYLNENKSLITSFYNMLKKENTDLYYELIKKINGNNTKKQKTPPSNPIEVSNVFILNIIDKYARYTEKERIPIKNEFTTKYSDLSGYSSQIHGLKHGFLDHPFIFVYLHINLKSFLINNNQASSSYYNQKLLLFYARKFIKSNRMELAKIVSEILINETINWLYQELNKITTRLN